MLFGKRLEGQSMPRKHPLKYYVITTWRLCEFVSVPLFRVFVRVLTSLLLPPNMPRADWFMLFLEKGEKADKPGCALNPLPPSLSLFHCLLRETATLASCQSSGVSCVCLCAERGAGGGGRPVGGGAGGGGCGVLVWGGGGGGGGGE